MKQYIILLFLSTTYFQCFAQTDYKTIELEINGKKYDTLYLYLTFAREDDKKFLALTTDQRNWKFSIPDTIYEKVTSMSLTPPTKYDTIQYHITSTKRCGLVYLPANHKYILDYVKSDTIKKASFLRGKDLIMDSYNMSGDFDEGEMEAVCFSSFHKEYFQQTDSLKYLVMRYPNSYGLVSAIGSNVNKFESREGLAAVYDLFSDNIKHSYFGKRIHTFLYKDNFIDRELTNPVAGNKEFIVSDKAKPTLVIFSAFWCGPCHKMIPTYKQIYSDLNGYVNLVYITIDEQNTIESWNKFLKQENIPWRSLGALDQSKQLMLDYYVPHIPYSFLIMPDNSITRLELREESGMKKLYEKVKK